MFLTTIWYQQHIARFVLMPFAAFFWAIVSLRRALYRYGIKKVYQVSVPVIIVGNLTIGGNGKTPLVIWLVDLLKKNGYRPGVVSRGYGGKLQNNPLIVDPNSNPAIVGDEPLLIARKTEVPVVVCRNRVKAAEMLIKQNCNVIVSDDGLQHYSLGRDIEIVVIDGLRRFGNGYCLPAGPLREPLSRLQEVDWRVVTQGIAERGEYTMALETTQAYKLNDRKAKVSLAEFKNQTVHAVAGIGNPDRFFASLKLAGLRIIEHPYPDHHVFSKNELEFADNAPVLITEKDAVKCEKFDISNCWVVAAEAKLLPGFAELLLARVRDSR